MASAAQEFAKAYSLPPEQALAYMAGRSNTTVTYDWRDLWQEEHARQFTISRLTRLDLLKDIQEAITASVGGDLSRSDFEKNVQVLLRKAGWWGENAVTDPVSGETVVTKFDLNRLRLIYNVNTRAAHAAGLWQRIEANKKTHPYIRYITRRDERVREAHRVWDNLTLPVDHPAWKEILPPNGWNCRCWFTSLTQAEYDRGLSPTGAPLVKAAPDIQYRDWVNKRTGTIERVPVGIDPGFAYHPGMAAGALRDLVAQKLAAAPEALAQAAIKGGLGTGKLESVVAEGIAKSERLPKLSGDAGAWVVGQGKATGFEYLQVFDANSGKVLAMHTSHSADGVGIPPAVVAMLPRRDVSLSLNHNHPKSVSLSQSDLKLLAHPGVWEVVAWGHDGSVFLARKGADTGIISDISESVRNAMIAVVEEYSAKGLNFEGLEAHILNLALARARLVTYDYTLDAARSARIEQESSAIEQIIQYLIDAINWEKKRVKKK